MSIWLLTAEPAVSVGGVRLAEIAERFGTPAYVVDEEHVRVRCREYAKAMAPHEVAYAAKAFWCRAMARWIAEEGLSLDVCSEGELAVARAAGFPGERVRLHGNGKTASELAAALDYGVGRIVVDSHSEVRQLAALTAAAPAGIRQKVLLRVTPGVDAHVHPAVTTGTNDQKSGLSIASGAAADVARRILRQPALELAGVHCHIGSQIAALDGFEAAARRLVAFMAGLGVGGLPQLNRYHVERAGVRAAADTEPVSVVGRHCEAGDVLIPDARLPADIRPGDLLAVPCTGAYHHAMASNYNYLIRPPVVGVRAGRTWPLVRRETIEDVLRRDVG